MSEMEHWEDDMYRIGEVEYGPELYHHGIKGMKWGVRRTPEELGHKVPPKRKAGGAQDIQAKKKRVKVSEASEERLRSAIARKKLENEYYAEVKRQKELKAINQNQRSAYVDLGKAVIEHVLGNAIKGLGVFSVAVAKGVADVGKEMIKDIFAVGPESGGNPSKKKNNKGDSGGSGGNDGNGDSGGSGGSGSSGSGSGGSGSGSGGSSGGSGGSGRSRKKKKRRRNS